MASGGAYTLPYAGILVLINISSSKRQPSILYKNLEGPLLKKENIFYLVITRKLTRNNEIINSL